jgi:Protein of unknown function (DUF3445)
MIRLSTNALPPALAPAKLFGQGKHRFGLGAAKLDATDFFSSLGDEELLRARNELLQERPEDFIGRLEPDDLHLVKSFAERWLGPLPDRGLSELGGRWEPDFVLLDLPALTVLGGCVCFPSGWSLREKIGRQLELVHLPVPGLNDQLADHIRRFLRGLPVGEAFQRSNWGLTGSDRWDQPPFRLIPLIRPDFDPANTYFRVEWQALIRLRSDRLFFGIRLFQETLADLRRRDQIMAQLLAENLRTMPEPVLRYKRLDQCRDAVVSYLGRQ